MTDQIAHLTAALLITCIGGIAQAGPYKCLQPGGTIIYQQSPCPPAAEGAELRIDTTPPGGAGAKMGSRDYSIESQLRSMQGERTRAQQAREKAEKESRGRQDINDGYDRARCAKHRAQVARWREAIRNGYHSQNEKEYEARMLEHHQALTERYCAGQ